MITPIQKPSPNFSSREGLTPKFVAIHISAGTLDSMTSWFSSKESAVSSHYGIGLSGTTIQYVDEKMAAWTQGRVLNPTAKIIIDNPGINPNRLGISVEHEGQDLAKAPLVQLTASANLIKDICTRHNIPIDAEHIVLHKEIFSGKPNCPSPDSSIKDRLIQLAKGTPPSASDLAAEFAKLEQQVANLKKLVVK